MYLEYHETFNDAAIRRAMKRNAERFHKHGVFSAFYELGRPGGASHEPDLLPEEPEG